MAGVVVGDLGDGGDAVVPLAGVIGLEGVVEPVLAHPERHQLAAHGRQRVDAAFCQVDGGAADFRVRMAEGAEAETGVGVVAHRKAVQGHGIVGEEARQFGGSVVVEMVGEVQVGGIKAFDPARGGNHFGNRIALLLERVEPGCIARAVREGHDGPWGEKSSGWSRSRGAR